MKKIILGCLLLVSLVGMGACGNDKNNSTENKKESTSTTTKSTTVETASNATKSSDPSKDKWTFKDDIFSAGILTYKITKTEVRDATSEGKKALVVYTDVTNNSDKEQKPSNVYMVLHAYQKTDTSNKQLNPGAVALDDNAKNPLQVEEDALNDSLLPGKTVNAVIIFTLENENQVTLKFDDADFNNIGEKTINVN